MKTVVLLAGLLALTGCGEKPEWKGWIYPDHSNLTRDIPIGAFNSLEECRNSARPLLANFNLYQDGLKVEGDYECGFKCKKDDGLGGLNVCEKTER